MGAAFFLMSFVILTRSLRESLFLSEFGIEKLPLIMGTVVLFSLPAVGQFSKLMATRQPRRVLGQLTFTVAAGQVLWWKLQTGFAWAIPAFYVWTAIGSLLMASGFWLVTAELFPLRGAKRLFSLISAGGTVGAMGTGLALTGLIQRVSLSWMMLFSALPPLLFFFMVHLSSRHISSQEKPVTLKGGPPLLEAIRTTWGQPDLRLMAGIIFAATFTTTLVDFQFKDLAQARLEGGPELAGFFGTFYGVSGLLALLLQVMVSSRLIERRGVGFSLSISSCALVLGGMGLLFFPSLLVATSVRGTDYALRKSLFRPTMEVLFVSIPTRFRSLTKTFIDSIVDSSAEGFGALVILVWLTILGWPIWGLSALVVVFALLYFGLSRKTLGIYLQTISKRLQEEEESRTPLQNDDDIMMTGNLLMATFTNLDLTKLMETAPDLGPEGGSPSEENNEDARILDNLNSPDERVVLKAMDQIDPRDPKVVPLLTKLMARDELFQKVVNLLKKFPNDSVPLLILMVQDSNTDFVLRRRIPEVLAYIGGPEADDALLGLLTDHRFEVRYRAAVGLLARRKSGLPLSEQDWPMLVWHAVSLEVRKDRPLWELHRLLDRTDLHDDDLITLKVGVRGELSLEHTFRLLSLVLDPEQIRAAYHGVIFDDPELKSFALEYLEMILPRSIKERLWFYIGDISEQRLKKQSRDIDNVVADMMVTGQTLFGGEVTREALDKMVSQRKPGTTRGKDE